MRVFAGVPVRCVPVPVCLGYRVVVSGSEAVNVDDMDTPKLTGLDLFSGLGGISKALEPWVRTITYCEQDEFCQSVLLSRMRTGDLDVAPIWDDVTTLKGDMFGEAVDIIYGGFPCQDVSVAGRGAGLEGKRSGLFFEIVRLAEEIKPPLLLLENVPAITCRGGLRVANEIASLGYDCRFGMLSAAEVGALHKRERWFLLAYKKGDDSDTNGTRFQTEGKEQQATGTVKFCAKGTHSDTNSKRFGTGSGEDIQCEEQEPEGSQPCDVCDASADAEGEGLLRHWVRGRSCKAQPFPCLDYDTREWQEAVCAMGRLAPRVSNYMASIRALGNSVVPSQVREAFKLLSGVNNSRLKVKAFR